MKTTESNNGGSLKRVVRRRDTAERVPQYDVELRLAAEVCEEYRAENAMLRERLKLIAEDERACCPDGVGFREYIARLKSLLAKSPNGRS